MDYLKILEHSYEETCHWDKCCDSKLCYLGDYIFEFTTYDSEMAALFASKAIEFCAAVTDKKTFDYIEDAENYKWFLIMCNMPFFKNKLEWGMSVRGCWWDSYNGIKISTTGLFIEGEQKIDWQFNESQWQDFINAIIKFSKETK